MCKFKIHRMQTETSFFSLASISSIPLLAYQSLSQFQAEQNMVVEAENTYSGHIDFMLKQNTVIFNCCIFFNGTKHLYAVQLKITIEIRKQI